MTSNSNSSDFLTIAKLQMSTAFTATKTSCLSKNSRILYHWHKILSWQKAHSRWPAKRKQRTPTRTALVPSGQSWLLQHVPFLAFRSVRRCFSWVLESSTFQTYTTGYHSNVGWNRDPFTFLATLIGDNIHESILFLLWRHKRVSFARDKTSTTVLAEKRNDVVEKDTIS